MGRRRGWQGSPPADDDEARARIVAESRRCLGRVGPVDFSLAHVAEGLGITRPTVYRYFDSTEHLLDVVGLEVAAEFLDGQAAHLAAHTDPAEWAVDAIAYAVEHVPDQPYLMASLIAGTSDHFNRAFVSEATMTLNRALFERSSIDWAELGYTTEDLDVLEEIMLRILHSLIVVPEPARGRKQLRAFIEGWLRPVVDSLPS